MAKMSDNAEARYAQNKQAALQTSMADMPMKSGGLNQKGPTAYPLRGGTAPGGPPAYPASGGQAKAPVKGRRRRKGGKKGQIPPQFLPGYKKKGM